MSGFALGSFSRILYCVAADAFRSVLQPMFGGRFCDGSKHINDKECSDFRGGIVMPELSGMLASDFSSNSLYEIHMTTSTHHHHAYELVLHTKVMTAIGLRFSIQGKQIATSAMHLERQGALTEASRYVDHLLAQQRAT